MSVIGRGLTALHVISAILVVAAAVVGYGVYWGLIGAGPHILWSFLSGIPVTFTHSMTLFYLFGTAAEMRSEAAGSAGGARGLEAMARGRKSAVLPLCLALASLAAAIILGGGSHTRAQPAWVHHAAGLAAVALNLLACRVSIRAIAINEDAMRGIG